MKHSALLALMFLFLFTITSCSDSDEPSYIPMSSRQTVFMYFPWSGSTIYTSFLQNIEGFESAIKSNHGLGNNSLIVFIAENENTSHLIKICYENGECMRDTLREYDFSSCDYTTQSGITSIINEVVAACPNDKYAMTIGCHGMGWIPVGKSISLAARSSAKSSHKSYLTRYFGHSSNSRYQTDITTLAAAIDAAGIKMQYILFDDCYMSNIETAYELRNVTDYLIASTCEVMMAGMPYDKIGVDLLNNDYKGIVDGFYDFYSTYSMPCGTIAVTDCSEIEVMADIMRQINAAYPDGVNNLNNIQDLDGYSPTIFFDFGDYVAELCTDQSLLTLFNGQLERLVPYKANTPTFYSTITNRQTAIQTFSGLTVSAPTLNRTISALIPETGWYQATH